MFDQHHAAILLAHQRERELVRAGERHRVLNQLRAGRPASASARWTAPVEWLRRGGPQAR